MVSNDGDHRQVPPAYPPVEGGAVNVGWVGLGDQGLPMARAVAQAGLPLHVWARRPASVEPLADLEVTVHGSLEELARVSDVVALCVSEDDDVLRLLKGGLLGAMRPGTVVVNHGTGTPDTARRIAELGKAAGVLALDAPVSGGRPAALARTLTTLVGGPEEALHRCETLFAAYSAHVVHLGGAGAGQTAKLFNNALLILNQAAIADVVDLAVATGTDPDRLVAALRLGSGSSRALTLLGEMVNPETVDHLSAVEDLDIDLFEQAMRDAGVAADEVVVRAHAGARGLPALVRRLPRAAAHPDQSERERS